MVGTPGLQPPLVPRRLGPFVLIEVLGRGRQAVVWKAVQFQPPRVVALKVFTTQWPLSDLSR
ncbi:MAG TPA: hypothetical protein VF590_11510, partial [Isosphaeraceae bacterium]